jgi:signal transduction histidine kinase
VRPARARGWLASLAATLPVLLALALAGAALPGPAAPGVACRVLPNAAVPWLGLREAGCPLRAYDRVLAVDSETGVRHGDAAAELRRIALDGAAGVRVLVSRGGRVAWFALARRADEPAQRAGRFAAAALLSTALLGTALAIRWGSTTSAATPVLMLATSASLASVAALCRDPAEALPLLGALGSGLLPQALAHLALCFPRERESVRRHPALLRALHAFGALLCGLCALNLERSAAVWMLADRALALLALLAWALLALVCIVAVRESGSTLERARARALLWGTLAVAALPLVVASASDERSLGLFSLAAGLLPLPIGYAIARYRLFDLGLALRSAIAYLLYALIASGCVGAGVALGARLLGAPVPLGDPVSLLALACVCFLAGEPLRARLRRRITGWLSPGSARLRAGLASHASGIAELLDPDACARRLCATLRDGLAAESVSVFLAEGRGLRLVDAAGNCAALATATAEAAAQLLGDVELLQLADEESWASPACAALRAEGVEVAARLRSGSEPLGLVLLGGSRTRLPYTSAQLGFLRSALALTAVAAHRAGLARKLLEAERFATLGRVGSGLVHDLGKPLGVVERLAARLHERAQPSERVQRDAGTIAALAGEMRGALRAFLGAAEPGTGGASELAIDALVDRAIRLVARDGAGSRVAVRLAPGLPRLRSGSDLLVRVLANLVDNALHASAASDVVSVIVIEESGRLCFEVSDRGCGMDAAVAARAFEPFFTTRSERGGSGLGLAVCRDLVRGLGGTIELDSAPGAGTRVRVTLPLAARDEQDAA